MTGARGYRTLGDAVATVDDSAAEAFARDVLAGLSGSPKTIPSRYFYDARGSALFEAITRLEEYYPTRCEAEILREHCGALAAPFVGTPFDLVELGAGDGRKTDILLRRFLDDGLPFRFHPVDISEAAVRKLLGDLRARHGPRLDAEGLVAEYFDALAWLRERNDRPVLVLLLGSNIGNFPHPEARRFLRRLRRSLNPGDRVLVGFDLEKDPEVLRRAYNDREGVTREFNLNLLDRINRELGADFDRTRFHHEGRWDPLGRRMESFLRSRGRQEVRIAALDRTFLFEDGEEVRTEYSCKYTPEDIDSMSREAGFEPEALLTDRREWFADAVWRVGSGALSAER